MRVALLVAEGVDGQALTALAERLTAAGAVPRFVGSRFGPAPSVQGNAIEVDVTVEAMPSVLYDAVVVPDGKDAVGRLSADGRVLEFLKDQYRHCKPILVLGGGTDLLARAGIPRELPAGGPDPGLVIGKPGDGAVTEAFMAALAKHRHFERETDPPRV